MNQLLLRSRESTPLIVLWPLSYRDSLTLPLLIFEDGLYCLIWSWASHLSYWSLVRFHKLWNRTFLQVTLSHNRTYPSYRKNQFRFVIKIPLCCTLVLRDFQFREVFSRMFYCFQTSPCSSTRSSIRGTSPLCSPSTRSSFSARQPYLGWRSQERLNNVPRTPHERYISSNKCCSFVPVEVKFSGNDELIAVLVCGWSTIVFFRLASSLLQQQQSTKASEEIQSSIKEVTSAIVHYVSALEPANGDVDRQPSPRSSQKLYWLESSFVGQSLFRFLNNLH